MNSDKICFTCVAFGQAYVDQQTRLLESIKNVMPEAEYMFWTHGLPPNSKTHHESLYGFKVHAVNEAIKKGFRKIVFLDPACILMRECSEWFLEFSPVLAARDDHKLMPFCSNEAWEYFGYYPWRKEDLHLVGGSVYVFDFNFDITHRVFKHWYSAEQDGLFGHAKMKPAYHRNDEACMALALDVCNLAPISCPDMGYNSGNNPIIIKKHFK